MVVRKIVLVISVCFGINANIVAQNNVVGYLPTYNNFPNSINNVDLNTLTHVNVAFLNPDASGNIYMPNGLATVVNTAHAKNVKVQISICGGAGDANTYHTILSNSTLTNTFIANLVKAAVDNNLDGIDVDIEGNVLDGNYVTPAQYESFVLKLGVALHAQNKLMTAALAGWFKDLVTNTAAQAFDFIGLMSYDAYGGWTGPGQHSSYQMAVDDFNEWKNNKGVDPLKLLVGLPFYGYGWGVNQRAWAYADVVNTYAGAENSDQIGAGADVIYYNGIPTIKQKTTFAKANAGGVMTWELTQDIAGAKSLLKAIGEVMGTNNADLVPDNLAKSKTVTVSSTEAGANVLANATDGLYSTRWASLYTDAQWMYVDLGDIFNINRVKITWETASAKAYQIQFSEDAENWITINTITNNTTLVNDYMGLSGKAKYVRINCTARNTVFGYSIFELEVYGTALPKPYTGTAISIPGTVQAENYDLGGEGVAYHDLTPTNIHGQYRTDGVDMETCTDAGGGFNIGGSQMGEWTLYSIHVTSSGLYDISVRVAATAAGKTMSIEMDGVNVSGNISVPNTGGWQVWQTVTIKNVQLSSGIKLMKVIMGSDLINLNSISLAKSEITSLDDNDLGTFLKLYPNPCSNTLFYELENTDLHQVKICNLLGEIVFEEFRNQNKAIHVSQFNTGIYFFELIHGNNKYITKLMIE